MDKRVTDQDCSGIDRSTQIYRLPDGRRLGYAEYGDPTGHPVIALHGTPGSRYMFEVADDAARVRGLRVIAPDRAGYGRSDLHHFDMLAETAFDIQSLVDALGIDHFGLVGVSGGGPYAVAVAALMKERLLSMALVSPVGPIADNTHIRMSHFHRFLFTNLISSPMAAGTFLFGLKTLIHWAPSTAYYLLTQYVTESDSEVLHQPRIRTSLQKALSEGLRPGIEGALQDLRLCCGRWNLPINKIGVPTVMWQGSADTNVPADAAYFLAGALADCRLEVIEGAGHYWLFGQIARVLDEMRATWEHRR
jgi:pimeloyl-ACP methyl ester carboxylesterase